MEKLTRACRSRKQDDEVVYLRRQLAEKESYILYINNNLVAAQLQIAQFEERLKNRDTLQQHSDKLEQAHESLSALYTTLTLPKPADTRTHNRRRDEKEDGESIAAALEELRGELEQIRHQRCRVCEDRDSRVRQERSLLLEGLPLVADDLFNNVQQHFDAYREQLGKIHEEVIALCNDSRRSGGHEVVGETRLSPASMQGKGGTLDEELWRADISEAICSLREAITGLRQDFSTMREEVCTPGAHETKQDEGNQCAQMITLGNVVTDAVEMISEAWEAESQERVRLACLAEQLKNALLAMID